MLAGKWAIGAPIHVVDDEYLSTDRNSSKRDNPGNLPRIRRGKNRYTKGQILKLSPLSKEQRVGPDTRFLWRRYCRQRISDAGFVPRGLVSRGTGTHIWCSSSPPRFYRSSLSILLGTLSPTTVYPYRKTKGGSSCLPLPASPAFATPLPACCLPDRTLSTWVICR